MGPTRADNYRRIRRTKIRPLLREPPELSCLVVEEDAVLAPRLPAFDEVKGAAMQWMKGMSNAKGLRRTARRRCI
jgi:hypothetical protein